MGEEEYSDLSSFLKRFVRRVKIVRGAEGLCLIGVSALLVISLGMGIQEIKTVLPYAPLAYSLLSATVALFLVGWTIFQCMRKVSKERAARYIEERQPQLRNNLINSLQLYPEVADKEKSPGISNSMVLALLRVTRTQLQGIQVEDLISTDRIKTELRLLGLLLIPALGLVIFNPSSVGETFSLLIHPRKDLPPSETSIDVTPKGARVERSSTVTIQATASGAIPKSMDLILSSGMGKGEGEPFQENLIMEKISEGKFSAKIQEVHKSLQYRVAVGPFSSPWYTLEAVDPPEIGNLKITLYPPHYTGLPTQTFHGGNIEGIRGSTLILEAESSKEVAKAKLLLDEGREVPLRIAGKRLQGNLVLFQSQRYRILAEDLLGFRNSPIPYEIRALPDGFPTVNLLKPTGNLEVQGDETLVLEFGARDDFGIQEVSLVVKVGDKEEKIAIQKDGNEKLIPRERYHWDLGRLGLREGDEVIYHLEVLDNDTISGPKMGSSRTLRLRLKDLKAEHKQVAEMIRDLSDQMVDLLGDHLETPLSPEKERLSQGEPFDETFEQKAQEVMQRIEEVMERTQIDRLSNFATWSDLESLKRNLQFTKDELLKKKAEASSLEEKTKLHDEISSELERMSLLAEEMGKRLTAQEVASTAQDLMKTQERFLDSLEKLKSGDKELDAVLEELSKLANQLASLQQALSQFASRLPDEFINQEAMRGLQFGEMLSALDEIRKKLMQGDIQGAVQLARELFNQMASMVAALRNAQQMAMSSMMGRMQGEMMRSTSELERIMREQQEILAETEGVHKENLLKRENVLKEKLDRFQAKAQEELSRLAELFADQESEDREESTEKQFDDFFLNHVIKSMITRLNEKDLSALAEIMEMARKELAKKDSPELKERRQDAEARLKRLMEQLTALLELPVVDITDEQKKGLRNLSSRQAVLKEQTTELHEKLNSLFQLFPSLDPKIIRNIREAANSMLEAQYQLGDLNAKEAIPPEEEALEQLSQSSQQIQASMQRLAQRGQLGQIPLVYLFRRGRFIPSGRLFPLPGVPEFPQFDVEGGITGFDTEKFELPGKDDYKVPRKFREEILESLKQGVPDHFKDQIESYFKDLSQ
ncbi:MAG: DUF4175 family protein [Candidatus Binatia bacterium]